MKKILALLCGLAFASGAWGETHSYNFIMDITCPTSFTSMSAAGHYYLLNKQTHQVYLAWAGTDWGYSHKDGDRTVLDRAVVMDAVDFYTYQGERYDYISGTYGEGANYVVDNISEDRKTKKVTFYHSLSTTHEIKMDEIGPYVEGYATLSRDLLLVIEDPELERAYELTFNGPLAVAPDTSKMTLLKQANGSGVMVAVPEPTSGLLLLLGVAGLALRRRKVA